MNTSVGLLALVDRGLGLRADGTDSLGADHELAASRDGCRPQQSGQCLHQRGNPGGKSRSVRFGDRSPSTTLARAAWFSYLLNLHRSSKAKNSSTVRSASRKSLRSSPGLMVLWSGTAIWDS